MNNSCSNNDDIESFHFSQIIIYVYVLFRSLTGPNPIEGDVLADLKMNS